MTDLKFRKKPVVIEAVHWNGSTTGLPYGGVSSYDEHLGVAPSPTSAHEWLVIPSWFPPVKIYPSDWSEAEIRADVRIGEVARYLAVLYIGTLEGVMIAVPGDWIIRGVNGELYPCKPDIFAKTYEATVLTAAPASVAEIVPERCSGIAFAFEPGVLHVNKDGSGYIAINESDFACEDDRCEGPDGPEGSIHWIARMPACEMQALRNFLNGANFRATPPLQEPSDVAADAARWRALLAGDLSLHGTGGFGHGDQPPDTNGYRHFGMSFTSIKSGDEGRAVGNAQACRVLIEYADTLRRAKGE